ncbi:DUF6588 family protein [Fulvivirga sp.]|jgi:hypothetical protein|uniref:DUF6588 family protein n=2 Tax=Fulvivirga sp. TaxID=1931237 RepID=UPI0032EB6B15
MKIRVGLSFLVFCLISNVSKAQDDLDVFLESGIEDANKLAQGYLEPFLGSFSSGLTGGWYNTAKAHKSAGFDLTVTANAVYIPSDQYFYRAEFNNLTYDPAGPQVSPTIFGPEGGNAQPTYNYSFTEEGQTFEGSFQGPEGIGLKENFPIQAMPVPMAQLGIGIVKNTDIKIRWTPKIDLDDNSDFKLIGFAVMHDVKQHIPGIKDLPFDLSALIGFTDISINYDLAAESESPGPGAANEVITENGKGVVDMNAWTVQGIISKKFSVLTLYGSLGYNIVKSEMGLKGDYQIMDDTGLTAEREYTNPILVTYKQSGPRMTAGFRLKLAIVTLHADYTLQKYNTLSVGFGFAVR